MLIMRLSEQITFSTKWGMDYLSLREHSYDPITTRQGATTNGLGIEAQTNVLNIVSNNLSVIPIPSLTFTMLKPLPDIHLRCSTTQPVCRRH
jgi:hypothetical protein